MARRHAGSIGATHPLHSSQDRPTGPIGRAAMPEWSIYHNPLLRELDLDLEDDDEVIRALVEHPILIERPIVVKGSRALIGRPPEAVKDLL